MAKTNYFGECCKYSQHNHQTDFLCNWYVLPLIY